MRSYIILTIAIFSFILSSCASTSDLTLSGKPTIKLSLDREYSLVVMQGGIRAYMLNPSDGDSSMVLLVGDGGFRKTKKKIQAEYGAVTTSNGTLNGSKFTWINYKDSKHIYSTGESFVTDRLGKKIKVYMDLVANSPARMNALKTSLQKVTVL